MRRSDPASRITRTNVALPPFHGRGSGREAWIDYATEVTTANVRLFEMLDEQSVIIERLNVEVDRLRRRIAERRPPGGRAPTPDHIVERIECEIGAGGSDRSIARMFGVSHMTVHRIRRRLRA